MCLSDIPQCPTFPHFTLLGYKRLISRHSSPTSENMHAGLAKGILFQQHQPGNINIITHNNHISMGQCKKGVTPLLKHWSYDFLALTHRYVLIITVSSLHAMDGSPDGDRGSCWVPAIDKGGHWQPMVLRYGYIYKLLVECWLIFI